MDATNGQTRVAEFGSDQAPGAVLSWQGMGPSLQLIVRRAHSSPSHNVADPVIPGPRVPPICQSGILPRMKTRTTATPNFTFEPDGGGEVRAVRADRLEGAVELDRHCSVGLKDAVVLAP